MTTRMFHRNARAVVARALTVVVLTTALAVGGASPAAAHADYVSANPSPGTGMPQAPGAVVMRFSEPLVRDLSRIQVVGPTGEDVGEGPTAPVEGDPTAMQRRLGLLPPGQYTVRWITVSPLDGHTLRGSYTFGIGTSSRDNESVQAGPIDSEGVLGLLGRFVALTGLTLWAGAILTGRVAAAAGVPIRRLRRVVRSAPLLAAGGTGLSLSSSALVSTGSLAALPELLSTQSGQLRGAILVAGAIGALIGWGSSRRNFAAATALAVALVAEAASGHAASSPEPLLAVPAFAAHLGAAGVWLFAVTAAVLNPGGILVTLKALSPSAVRAASVVLVTGMLNSTLVLHGLGDFISTGYGRTLAAKIAAFTAMAGLGWLHYRRRVHHNHGASIHGPVRGELVAGALVLVLATVLVGFPSPPREVEEAAQRMRGDPLLASLSHRDAVSVGDTAGPYVVGLTVLPPSPGPVQLRVQVLGVQPGDALRKARILGSGPNGARVDVPLQSCGKGCFAGDGRISARGTWTFDFLMTSNRGPVRYSTKLPVPTPDGKELLSRALRAMGQLDTARVDELLREEEGGDIALVSHYQFERPDRMQWAVEGGTTRIGIGTQGYIRQADGGGWKAYDWSAGGFRWPDAFYDSFFAERTAVRAIGEGKVDGRSVSFVTFVQPSYPAWYRLAIDQENSRIIQLEMRAERHVMNHTYTAFNGPVRIRAPEVAGG